MLKTTLRSSLHVATSMIHTCPEHISTFNKSLVGLYFDNLQSKLFTQYLAHNSKLHTTLIYSHKLQICAVTVYCNIYGRPMEQGRPLYFCPVVSGYWFLLSSIFFFPQSMVDIQSPTAEISLSGRRLDVYHTLAHGVALVRI